MLEDCGYFIKSIQAYEQSLMLVQEHGLMKEEALICYRIAGLNSKMDNQLEAWTYYRHSLSILSNLPYNYLRLRCIDGCIRVLEKGPIDEKMVLELYSECLKVDFVYIAQSLLNTFIQNSRDGRRFLETVIGLNSEDKPIKILNHLLTQYQDQIVLNAMLRAFIECGDYKRACDFYSEWKESGFGYLETLMMSCVDKSLSSIECVGMSLKLNGMFLHLNRERENTAIDFS